MLKRVKDLKKNKKGFTLVELIVVLVILAILIALLLPALTGYIDKANEKKIAVEARAIFTAAQTLASEEYAANLPVADRVYVGKEITSLDTTPAGSNQTLKELSEVSDGKIKIKFSEKGKIDSFSYIKDKMEVKYTPADGWKTGKENSTPDTP